jgi:hypothetical protein
MENSRRIPSSLSAYAARQLVAPKETKAEAPLWRDGGRTISFWAINPAHCAGPISIRRFTPLRLCVLKNPSPYRLGTCQKPR